MLFLISRNIFEVTVNFWFFHTVEYICQLQFSQQNTIRSKCTSPLTSYTFM